ncbi:MAG: CotH kinase family protein [Bacteroidales bacterium]|nr:CotH kinase family protein [Bacteroidales bacterium]
MMKIRFISIILLWAACALALADDGILNGTILNNSEKAFDGDPNTYFASTTANFGWAGKDLGIRHVITKVGWMPRDNVTSRMLLGVFEGANSPDFMDALPIAIIHNTSEVGKPGVMSYAEVNCSQGFRYVRYVGPSTSFAHVAELQFYGHKGMGDHSNLYRITNLPTVTIHTIDNTVPRDKVNEISAQITIIGDSTCALLSEPGTIRERGNASRGFPKKPWRIKFNSKQHVLDAPAHAKKWTLINNYGDKTLMRNLLVFELSERLGMPYTPYGRAVDVLLNGEYKGCYQLCDQVQVHKQRVDIEEMTPRDNSGIELTGGYFFEIDAYAENDKSYFYSSKWTPVSIKSPDEDSITNPQKNYIKSHFNKMESDWSRYLDLNTFLRHFLVGELSGNIDTYWSVFMYKHRENDTIYTGPVWDFDLAFYNDGRIWNPNDMSDYVYRSGGSYAGNMRNFVDKIVVYTPSTKEQLLNIWDKARHNGIDEEHLVAFIDAMEEELQQSQELNFLRWPIMNRYVHQNPRIWGSYAAEVENVRSFMRKRIEWMDNKLGYTYVPESIDIISDHNPDDIDFSRPYRVYSLSGQPCGTSLVDLPAGIYIIRQGPLVKKVFHDF